MKMNDQKITIFYTRVTKKIKMFRAPTLPPAKKGPAINRHFIYHLKGMKTRILMFWEM